MTQSQPSHPAPISTTSGIRLRHSQPLTRQGQFLRIAIDGATNAGKTFTAMMFALSLADDPSKIAYYDTEHGSAGLYSVDLENAQYIEHVIWEPPYDPRDLRLDIRSRVEQHNLEVVVVDSGSHFWKGEGGVLNIVDTAKASYSGNKFGGWIEGDAAQNDMIAVVKETRAHMIVCMQSKMAYVLEEGAKKPTRVGMQPVQRDGFEYELDVILDMDQAHTATVTKSRFFEVKGQYPVGHTLEIIEQLKLEVGRADPIATREQLAQITAIIMTIPVNRRTAVVAMAKDLFGSSKYLTVNTAAEAIDWFRSQAEAAANEVAAAPAPEPEPAPAPEPAPEPAPAPLPAPEAETPTAAGVKAATAKLEESVEAAKAARRAAAAPTEDFDPTPYETPDEPVHMVHDEQGVLVPDHGDENGEPF